jgi:hypothetical protein
VPEMPSATLEPSLQSCAVPKSIIFTSMSPLGALLSIWCLMEGYSCRYKHQHRQQNSTAGWQVPVACQVPHHLRTQSAPIRQLRCTVWLALCYRLPA